MRQKGAMKTVARFFSLMSLVGLFLQPMSAQENWRTFRYPADGVAFDSPTEPTSEKQDQQTAAGLVTLHNYFVSLKDTEGVMFSVTNFGRKDVDLRQVLDGAKNGAVQEMAMKITSEKACALGGNEGVEFEAGNANAHVRARMYYISGRLYQAMILAPAAEPFAATLTQIFDSMALIPIEN